MQRFQFDLAPNLHTHSIAMDGAYDCDHDPDCNGDPDFFPAPEWTLPDLEHIVARIDRDIAKLLEDDVNDLEHGGLAVCASLGRSQVRTTPAPAAAPRGLGVHGQYAALHFTPVFDGRDRKRASAHR